MKRLPSPLYRSVAIAPRLLIGIGIGFAVTGCQQPKARPDPRVSAASAVAPAAGAPLPERTPFDDDLGLRAVYLEWYTSGYNLAATQSEYTSPGCLCEARGDPRKYSAMADGFFAGREAGERAARSASTPPEKPVSR